MSTFQVVEPGVSGLSPQPLDCRKETTHITAKKQYLLLQKKFVFLSCSFNLHSQIHHHNFHGKKKYACRFFSRIIYFFCDFLFSSPQESSFPQRIPVSALQKRPSSLCTRQRCLSPSQIRPPSSAPSLHDGHK